MRGVLVGGAGLRKLRGSDGYLLSGVNRGALTEGRTCIEFALLVVACYVHLWVGSFVDLVRPKILIVSV